MHLLKRNSLSTQLDSYSHSSSYLSPEKVNEYSLKANIAPRISLFQGGFRLCAGLDSTSGLSINDVFIEPFGEFKDKHVVIRSRKCEFMLEMEEMYSTEKIELDRASCVQCGLLQNDAICLKVESNRNEFQVDEESDHYDK